MIVVGIILGNIDTLLRPRLVRGESKLSGVLILISTLGGIKFMGISGIIIGPILGVLFSTLWEIYARYIREVKA